jgi:hypothetical protein
VYMYNNSNLTRNRRQLPACTTQEFEFLSSRALFAGTLPQLMQPCQELCLRTILKTTHQILQLQDQSMRNETTCMIIMAAKRWL